MKKQVINRLLSIVLALVMVIGMLPITALAADYWKNPRLYVADVTVVYEGALKNGNPVEGASVSYDSVANTATVTLNNVDTNKHLTSINGGAIEAYDIAHLYIVLADGSENNFEVSWWGADNLSVIYANCPITISGNGSITATMNNISGSSYGYYLTYAWGIRSTSGTVTICDGANVNLALDVSSSNKCYGAQADNIVLRDANLSINMKNNNYSSTTACLNGTVSLISGSLSMKTNRGDIGGTINAQGATSSTAPDGTVTYTMTPHAWNYSAFENTIKAWCTKSNHNCDYFGEAKALALSITAADTTYDKKDITTTNTIEIMGGSYEITTTNSFSTKHPGAVLSDSISAITSDKNTSITYIGMGETNYSSTTPPSEAGTYVASITLGGASATDDFTIAKADLAYTVPTAKDNLTYKNTAQELINAGSVTTQWYNINQPSTCGRMEYRLGTTGEWSTAIPTAQDVGTYQVYWRVVPVEAHAKNYALYESSEPMTVSIKGLDISNVSVSQNNKLTYDGGKDLVPTVTANATTVNNQPITFTYSTLQDGSYGSMPTFTKAGTYTVYFKATAPNHNETTGSFTVTVEKATVTEPTIASKPYTGSAQTADITDTELYTVVKNDGGMGVKLNGYYDIVLKLKDSANYKWSTTDNAQVTLQFAITRAENEWAVNPSISDWTYGETPNTPVGEAKFGEASVEYSGTTNGGATYSSTTAPTEAGSYKATFTVQETEDYSALNTSVDFTIAKADQAAPTGLTKTDTTYFGKADGKISGLTSAMEFRKEGDSSYTAGFNGTLEYLAAGTYYVRYQGDANHNPSPDAVVTVNAGRKLQIVVPQNQVGYTVTVNKTEMEYEGSYTLKVEIHEGYTATEDFKIIISNWECGQQAGVEETYMNAIAHQIIEVRGVADITPPAAEIKVKENKWTSFWNNLTFGLFFKETQDVTITTTDKGSGVKSIQYYLSDGELELDEVKAISDWVDYNGTFKIDPNNRYVVYAKVTDNTGNTLYINSDGIVLDNIAPTLEGIENGKTYYGDLTVIKSDEQFYDIKTVTLDGEEIGFAEGTYGLIPADNAEHIVVVEDHAGNKTTYTVTVMKNYTVTYKADGEPISTETVGHGKDANLPAVPAKNGYVGKWDSDGKNITGDTTITVVYTEIPVVKPNEVKLEDNTDLEDTKKQLEDMLKDDSYTDDDKKDIQDAIDDIDDALEVIGNVEEVEETISKLPAVDTVKPDDEEAIKAIAYAQTAYNALSDNEKSLVDEAAKANLDKLVAALVAYDIVEGDGSSWTEDSNHNITFVVNGLFSKFVGIKVDGKDVDKANYEVKAGSTIITLKASYLDTLAVGEHTITVVYTDGSTDGTFNVHAKANSPATGDNSNMFLWIALLFISGGAVITLTVVDRKRRMASNK